MTCILCRNFGGSSNGPLADSDGFQFDCPICGRFRVTARAEANLSDRGAFDTDEVRLKLSWATRRASERGAPLEIDSENIEEIARSVTEPKPRQKLDEMLLYLADRSKEFGGSVVTSDWDFPLIPSRSNKEFLALRSTLVEMQLVRAFSPQDHVLTASGWERVAKLQDERPRSTAAFVAMAFHPSMSPAFNEGFCPALYGLGYDPVRVDREEYLGKIDDFIVASIRKSSLVVADFTGMRSGVFFEAGFGLGLGIPVVWTCREDDLSKLGEHFDTRQYNHLIWTKPQDLATKLRTRIEATVVHRPRSRT